MVPQRVNAGVGKHTDRLPQHHVDDEGRRGGPYPAPAKRGWMARSVDVGAFKIGRAKTPVLGLVLLTYDFAHPPPRKNQTTS